MGVRRYGRCQHKDGNEPGVSTKMKNDKYLAAPPLAAHNESSLEGEQ
jgi:hypothetical protein